MHFILLCIAHLLRHSFGKRHVSPLSVKCSQRKERRLTFSIAMQCLCLDLLSRRQKQRCFVCTAMFSRSSTTAGRLLELSTPIMSFEWRHLVFARQCKSEGVGEKVPAYFGHSKVVTLQRCVIWRYHSQAQGSSAYSLKDDPPGTTRIPAHSTEQGTIAWWWLFNASLDKEKSSFTPMQFSPRLIRTEWLIESIIF